MQCQGRNTYTQESGDLFNLIGTHTSKCRNVPRDDGIGPFRLLARAVKTFNGEELSKLSGMMPPNSLSSAQVTGLILNASGDS